MERRGEAQGDPENGAEAEEGDVRVDFALRRERLQALRERSSRRRLRTATRREAAAGQQQEQQEDENEDEGAGTGQSAADGDDHHTGSGDDGNDGAGGGPPFRFRKLDHVVIRCVDVPVMERFYADTLGASRDWVGHFGGTLSHLRVGDSLIDLVDAESELAFGPRAVATEDERSEDEEHAGKKKKQEEEEEEVGSSSASSSAASAASAAATSPPPPASTLDHLALRCEDFDPSEAEKWLQSRGAEVVSSGPRYGADGNGFSIYVRDPEGNVVELKCGPLQ